MGGVAESGLWIFPYRSGAEGLTEYDADRTHSASGTSAFPWWSKKIDGTCLGSGVGYFGAVGFAF